MSKSEWYANNRALTSDQVLEYLDKPAEVARFVKITRELTSEFLSSIGMTSSDTFVDKPPHDDWNFGRAPKTLYHYTSLEGFLGIMESNSLLFTNLLSVNDGAEVLGLFAQVREILLSYMKHCSTGENEFIRFLLARMRRFGHEEVPRSFASSFTSERDSTLQWQHYGKANGICLGFSTRELRSELSRTPHHFLFRCIYSPDESKALLRDSMLPCLTAAYAKYLAPIERESVAPTRNWVVTAHAVIFAYAQFFGMVKNRVFEHEKEWRAIFYLPFTPPESAHSNVEIEAYRHPLGYLAMRHRYRFTQASSDFMQRAISEIIIGPNPHASRHQLLATQFAVRCVLKKHGIRCLPAPSNSPLRPSS